MAVASSLLDITPQRITAVPGAPLSFELTAHNETRSIRNLTIELVGMDGATVTTNPTTILVPPEGDATIDVRVDLPFIAVGDTSFGFELTDATTGELFGYGDVAVTVDDITAARLKMPRSHMSGMLSDTTEVIVTNTGDTPLRFKMRATSPGKDLHFEFDPPEFVVPGNRSHTTSLEVSHRVRWLGGSKSHVFDVAAQGSSQSLSVAGQFRQHAVFPPLIFKVLLSIVLIVGAVILVRNLAIRLIADIEPFTWEELANAPDEVAGRYGHSAVWVEFEPPDPPGGLSARFDRVLDWVLGRNDLVEAMIVWGGADANGQALADGAMYSVKTREWASITDAENSPQARAGHGVVWTGSRMVIWGGRANGGAAPLPSGAQFDPQKHAWRALPLENAPSPRQGHSTIWTGSELVVFGGESFAGEPLADGAILRPDRITGELADGAWDPLPTFPGEARSFHAAAWTGDYMVVFGGFTATGLDFGLAQDAYAFEPDRDRWWDVTRNAAPSGRACQTALDTGDTVMFLGGVDAADLNLAIRDPSDEQIVLDPGFQGLCRIPIDISQTDPTAWSLAITPGEESFSSPVYEWTRLENAPHRLANRFAVRWTGSEASVFMPIEQLDTVAAVRYTPDEPAAPLPIATSDVMEFTTDYTIIWINGGMIVFGGRNASSCPDDPAVLAELAGRQGDRCPTTEGALLVLPDR